MCVFVNAITLRTVADVIMTFLWEQDMVNSSYEFGNSCFPMHCGARCYLTSYISYHHRLAIALLIWCSVAPYNDTVKNKITNKIK